MAPENGFRMTRQRRIILEEIRKIKSHPTADEVYKAVKKRLPHISLGTVYRNLDFLSSRGLIQKLSPVETQMRFDGNPENHYHFRCIKCGMIFDVPVEQLPEFKECVCDGKKCTVIGHRLELQGIGPLCCMGAESHGNERRRKTKAANA